ncbi:hypothetical protein FRB90_007390 [Tulasnella sp. 427]|nr:hypothetical protein FRB90_007390 [Tulasnella sp. 427]
MEDQNVSATASNFAKFDEDEDGPPSEDKVLIGDPFSVKDMGTEFVFIQPETRHPETSFVQIYSLELSSFERALVLFVRMRQQYLRVPLHPIPSALVISTLFRFKTSNRQPAYLSSKADNFEESIHVSPCRKSQRGRADAPARFDTVLVNETWDGHETVYKDIVSPVSELSLRYQRRCWSSSAGDRSPIQPNHATSTPPTGDEDYSIVSSPSETRFRWERLTYLRPEEAEDGLTGVSLEGWPDLSGYEANQFADSGSSLEGPEIYETSSKQSGDSNFSFNEHTFPPPYLMSDYEERKTFDCHALISSSSTIAPSPPLASSSLVSAGHPFGDFGHYGPDVPDASLPEPSRTSTISLDSPATSLEIALMTDQALDGESDSGNVDAEGELVDWDINEGWERYGE